MAMASNGRRSANYGARLGRETHLGKILGDAAIELRCRGEVVLSLGLLAQAQLRQAAAVQGGSDLRIDLQRGGVIVYGIFRPAEPQVHQCPAVEDFRVVQEDGATNETAGYRPRLWLQIERAVAIVQRLVQVAVARRPEPAARVQSV